MVTIAVAAVVLALSWWQQSLAPAQWLLFVAGVLALLTPVLPAGARRWLSGDLKLNRAQSVHVVAVMGVPLIFMAIGLRQNEPAMILVSWILLMASLWYSYRANRRIAPVQPGIDSRNLTWTRPTWGRSLVVATVTIIVGEFVGMVAYFGTLVGAASAVQFAGRWLSVDSEQVLNEPTELNVAILVVLAQLAVAIAITAVLLVLLRVMSMKISIAWAFLGAVAAVALEWGAHWATDSFQPWSAWTAAMVIPITLVVRWKAQQQSVLESAASFQ